MNAAEKDRDNQFLKSVVARRIFTMFVLCAILPLMTISAISLLYVGNQLEDQAGKRLHQQCKNKGFLIYERLVTLEQELKTISGQFRRGHLETYEKEPYDPLSREGSGWRRVLVQIPPEPTVPVIELDKDLPAISMDDLAIPDKDRTLIKILHSDDISPTILMVRRVDPSSPLKGIIAGEINPLYLWGIGITGALPPDIDFSVVLSGRKILISSIADYLISSELLAAYEHNSFSGKFESRQDGTTYINSYWSLFLNHRFSSPDWTIVFSQSKAAIMAPVINFRYIFFMLVLLTFWVILLLSIRSIRKKTVPMEILKAGAMKIAAGDFGHQVRITSKDEFEELADSFNEMSVKLKQGQAMLLQAAKMSTFGQMGAGIVHEVGQPLSAISGYAELLRMGTAPEKRQHFLDTICEQTVRLKDIISKFRTFSRVSEVVFQKISIPLVLQKTNDLLDHQLKMRGVHLDMEVNDGLPSIDGDENALQQVFVNLLNNAVDALAQNPAGERNIRITAWADGRCLNIEIADNGCGIPEKIQQSIFDPFFTTKSADKGTGLGLAIISSILHKHDAQISVESEVNEGTRFLLLFPVGDSDPG